MKKHNSFFKNKIMEKQNKSISHTQSTIKNMCKSQNNFRYNKNNNKNDKINNSKTSIIFQNNPLELTFGNSSFMSNIQTETNNDFVKNKNNKNKTFFKSINTNIHKKEKKDFIRHNKITKLKKKLLFNPNWKIKQESKNKNNNKSEIIIHNYKTKNKYEIINNHYTNININYREKNYHSVNISNELRKNNKKIKIRKEREKINKNNMIKNKILKNRNEKEKFRKTKIRSSTTKNSAVLQKNTLKKIKSSNNKEYMIKININDKENGIYKLIIKRTSKYLKRMPRSTPKLFLAHPSLKNLFL